jgi:hypothetical protein
MELSTCSAIGRFPSEVLERGVIWIVFWGVNTHSGLVMDVSHGFLPVNAHRDADRKPSTRS